MKITVLGAGAWGTAFGQVLADAGNDVTMWAIEPEIVEGIRDRHHNAVRLPSVERLPENMTATGDRAEAVRGAEIIIVSIAAQAARVALEPFRDLIPGDAIVVSLMKGIERATGKRMDEVVTETLGLPEDRFAAISGPNLSKEIAAREPAATVVACTNIDNARRVAHACTTHYFKAFVTTDVIGLEMCGSLKNVIALAVGMARGAGYGENTAAMIETRGLSEMTALGKAAGADPKTFCGLAGVGDLIATCGSPLSRKLHVRREPGQGAERGGGDAREQRRGRRRADHRRRGGVGSEARRTDAAGHRDEPCAGSRHQLQRDAGRTVRPRYHRGVNERSHFAGSALAIRREQRGPFVAGL